MKKFTMRQMVFMAICCDLGLFGKRIVAPLANILTDALHIPGGIGTAFSLMFLVIASASLAMPGVATIMGAVQSGLAVGFGMVGSMGALAPIGYILPGLTIDLIFFLGRKLRVDQSAVLLIANMLGSFTAAMTANMIVFRLWGIVLMLYGTVSLFSGAVCGVLAESIIARFRPVIQKGRDIL